MQNRNRSFIRALLVGMLLLSGFCLATSHPDALADDHGYKGKHFGGSAFSTSGHGRGDKGNELTGEFAAWIFGAANLPVLLSLLIRGLIHNTAMAESLKDRLKRFNQAQKKYLMPLHYTLNLLALLLASIHFSLSHCRSSSLPEWGLTIMASLAAIGMVIKFRISPKSMRRTVYQIHTHPLSLGLLVIVLLVGHSIID